MKKLLALLLALIMVLSLAACGEDEPKDTDGTHPTGDGTAVTEPSGTEDSETTGPEETEPTVSDDIGWEPFYFSNANGSAKVLIKFPVTIPENLDMVMIRTDLFIVDGYKEGKSPEVNSVSEVFPAYFDQADSEFAYDYGSSYSDGEFTLESSESAGIINGYEMYKFVGTHSFKWERDDTITRKFVAYATQLKGNGAYIYWLAEDKTDDQSMLETLEEYAYNMAQTLKEVDY